MGKGIEKDMGKQALLRDCKLARFRLLECSSKLLKDDLKKTPLKVSLSHEVNFCLLSKAPESDFCLNFNTEIKAKDKDDIDCFVLSAKFKADFNIFDKKKNPPENFENLAELLGHQLFPLIRSFFVDIFSKMGIPPAIPWSLQDPPVKGKKKTTPSAIKNDVAKPD